MTLKDFARTFFYSRQEKLQYQYPGLSVRRLYQELDDCGFDLGGIYFPYRRNLFKKVFFNKLTKGTPLAYISRQYHFFGRQFEIQPDVFIPRCETEQLVEMAIDELRVLERKRGTRPLSLLDVGVGSGNILLSILPEATRAGTIAVGVDVSKRAIETSGRNAFRLALNFPPKAQIKFIQSDCLLKIEEKFDLIVSNPPYIKQFNDSDSVHPQVHKWEPHRAIYLPDKKYSSWFKKFFKQVDNALVSGGVFLMEGHEEHLAKLAKFFNRAEIKPDLSGRNRFLRWVK